MGHAGQKIDADSAAEQLGNERPVACGHEGHVVVGGKNDADIDSAVACRDESPDDPGVGEVGILDPDAAARVPHGFELRAEQRGLQRAAG